MDKDYIIFRMAQHTQVNGKMVKKMGMGDINFKMEIFIKDNLDAGLNMGKGSTNTPVEIRTKDNFTTTINKDMES